MRRDLSLSWYFHRLSAMPIQEIMYRLKQAGVILLERMFGLPVGKIYASGWDNDRSWVAFNQGSVVRFFEDQRSTSSMVSDLYKDFPFGCKSTLRIADDLLEHRMEIFGTPFENSDPVDWFRDPLTGQDWPVSFWSGINYRDIKGFSGVKWVWEINRHYHILTLARAYYLSKDERYAKEAIAQIRSWIDQNPPLMGVNWTSSLELSIRLINWIWVLELIKGSPVLTATEFYIIERSISQQTTYIYRHLSAYSSANNHRVGEAAGLAFVGITYPWLAGARRWRKTGFLILTEEITKLILPDGGSAEQAPHYLLFIMDFYLLVIQLAKLNQISVNPVWSERLHAGACFLQSLIDPHGQLHEIGDNDDACVVRLDDRPGANNICSLLATAAVLFQDPSLKSGAIEWDEKSYWLLGMEGKCIFENLDNVSQIKQSRVFQESGIVVLQAADTRVLMDCGALGYGSTAAHGHSDALSLWAVINNENCLIDAGTYAYHEAGGWRSYFRGTSAHNTIRIDGRDQSEMTGPFLWGRKAECRLLAWKFEPDLDLVAAEHDGYKTSGVIHRRVVLFIKPDILIVFDQVLGSGRHQIEQFWHFAPEFKVEINGKRADLCIHHLEMVFDVWSSPYKNLYVVNGQDDPIQGWISTRYGQKTPAPVLVHSGFSPLPAYTLCAIFPKNLSQAIQEQTKNKVFQIIKGMGFLPGAD